MKLAIIKVASYLNYRTNIYKPNKQVNKLKLRYNDVKRFTRAGTLMAEQSHPQIHSKSKNELKSTKSQPDHHDSSAVH